MSVLMIGVKRTSDSYRAPDTIKVLVAKKDLPVQTKLDAKELDNLLTWADIPRSRVPADAVGSIEDVKDKELNRTLKKGDPVSYCDLGTSFTCGIPDGHKQITFRSSQVDTVAGLVRPGSKVDVMYVERMPSGKARAAIILKDMLVLAVGMTDRLKDDQGPAIPQVESVSLAVTDRQATMVALAEDKGKLKLVLRGNDKQRNTTIARTAAGVNEIEGFDDELDKLSATITPEEVAATPPQPPVKLETAVVARKSVPVNLLINADNVHTYFETVRLANIPNGVIQNPAELKGKYIIKAVDDGQYIYKTQIGNDPVDVKKGPPVGPPKTDR